MSILSHDPVLRRHGGTSPAVYALALAAACAVFIPMDAAAQACTQADQNGCTELSASPPQDTTAVPPNIVLLLDDSGSMGWTYMPDKAYLVDSGTYLVNAANNKVYYDPAIEYKAPPKADGVSFYPNITDITSAPREGFAATPSLQNITQYSNNFDFYHRINDGTSRRPSYRYFFRFAVGPVDTTQTVYYVAPVGQSCAGLTNCVNADHVGPPYAPAGVPVSRNIGNWFSYYHTRVLMAKSGLMTAFVDLSPNYRFGFGSLNDRNTAQLPAERYTSGMTISNVRQFGNGASGTNKAQFWKWLETMSPSSSTPLRRALHAAGKYYETAQPWESMEGDPNYDPTASNPGELACRASYTILTTDGFWNGADPNVAAMKQATDSDGTTYVDASGATAKYSAVPPFIGGNAVNDGTTANKGTSLADIAAYYWKRDLRPTTANLVPTNQNDPAFWQHMTTFTFGIGFEPVPKKGDPPLPMTDIFRWARDGGGSTSPYAIPGFSWPTPSSDNVTNIADMAHAAVVGRGNFFSATNPQELADGFAKAIAQISERNVASPPSSSNASVAVLGALSFKKSYNTRNWEGTLEAVELKPDGRTGDMKWDITSKLDAMTYTSRKIFTPTFTGVTCSGSTSTGAVFDKGIQLTGTSGSLLDCAQRNGLSSPAFDATNANDTLQNRIDYLLGDASFEGNPYRARGHRLGAILNSSPVYVSYPSASYRNIWPAGSAESVAEINGEGYGKYVTDNAEREGTVYVGANDGMLHAFSSPAPDCDFATDPTNPTCTYDANGGNERWAYVPRAVYANLGNLTDARTFAFRPTADASPRTRDVYFGGKWRTLLVSGVGLGGRGVYALDISDQENFAASDVLWEFNADSAVSGNCKSNSGSCQATDLGYTVPQPNIARLANGKWVVLVPNGYFPDCDMATVPTGEPERSAKPRCTAIAAQAPSNYSALFVLDAQTGAMIAELKTPTNISGVKSYGLGSVVVGDYENNQIDDVAFAGDLMGNLWRFDLTDANPANWKVTLAYKGKDNAGIQGVQPITVMPRLFPDLRSSRFMIVFGTGKYLGPGDNDAGIPVQAIYGIQEQVDTNGNLVPATFAQLRQQTLTEAVGTGDFTGATLRKLTDNALASNHQGWYINLDIATAKGERVVETPATIFPANTAIFRTLIPSTDNYCDPSTKGAVMSVSAANGGSNGGLSSLGGNDLVGARVSHAATGGTVPAMQSLGGGEIIIPVEIEVGGGVSTTPPPPLKVDSPMWRRRSWSNAETK